MTDASNPRDLLYGGRDNPREILQQPAATAPTEPVGNARDRALMFVGRMNAEGLGSVDYEDEGNVPQIYELATEHGLRVDIEQFRRILVLSRETGSEIGVALWKDSPSGSGSWALYVDAMRFQYGPV